MKNRAIDNFTATGKKMLFLVFLVAALAVAWFTALHLPLRKQDQPIDPKLLDEIVAKASQKHQVPAPLIKAVIWQESRFRPNRKGKAGEIGLMQIRPKTAVVEWMNGNHITQSPTTSQLFDPETNVDIGTWYLAWTGRHWNGYASQLTLQLAEYNAGYSNAVKWKPNDPKTELKLSNITFKSTRNYVKSVVKKMKEF